ncbi:MAG: sensor histidine kinase [Verrucomicrobiales bacterium]
MIGQDQKAAGINRASSAWILMAGLVAALVLPGHVALARERYSDPLRPPRRDESSSGGEFSYFRIPARLRQIEEEIERESRVLAELAPLQVGMQVDRFGYHSDYIPAVDGMPEEPLWTLDFGAGAFPTTAFVMVPALDQRSSDLRGYGFPKRFRISSVKMDGGRGRIHADWTARDFPDPGNRPVFFKFRGNRLPVGVLRLEVFAGHEDNGLEYFALGRVHPVRQGELQKTSVVAVSSGFESAPYWSRDYLASPRYTLGMPLSAKDGVGGNFVLPLPASTLPEPLVVRVDLDSSKELGWVNLFPGQGPSGINVPGYGFPKMMKILRVVRQAGDGKELRFLLSDQDLLENPGNNMLRIPGGGYELDALEIVCNDFPVYQGQAVFSLGEIEVIKSGRNLSEGRSVSIRGFELEEGAAGLGALVDGKVGGREILHLPEWIRQLAAGKPHEARLVALESERTRLSGQWRRIRGRLQVGGAVAAVAAVGGLVWFMVASRKRAQRRLRRQIGSDLHDDLGSSLGSISLIAEHLREADVNDEVREDIHDLSLIAREAWSSLREVVWIIDGNPLRLPELIQKLSERARRVLAGVEVTIGVPEDCVNSLVSLTFKRHLVMFFKEVVHNCARHAGAERVWVDFAVDDRDLRISVRDDGVGFDLTAESSGQGLESMRNRAREMGGELELDSRPGGGTLVGLRVPLKALLNKSDHLYKTSN